MRKIFFVVILCFFSSVFADSFDDLKKAFDEHSSLSVKSVLAQSSEEEKSDLESEVLAEVKKAVNADDLDYAYELTEAILFVDMGNEEAQKIYSSIKKIRKNREEARIKAEKEAQQKLEEAAALEKKLQEEAERQKIVDEYLAQKERELREKEKFVYAVSDISIKNFPMRVGFTPAAFDISRSAFASDFANSGVNCRYGFGGNFDIEFVHPYVLLDFRFATVYYPKVLKGSAKKADTKLRFSASLPMVLQNFCLTFSYEYYANHPSENEHVALYNKLSSPFIGVGFQDVNIVKNLNASFYVDLNLVMFDKDNEVDFAFLTESLFRYDLPWKISNIVGFFVENNMYFGLLRAANKGEFSLQDTISIGVSINAR